MMPYPELSGYAALPCTPTASTSAERGEKAAVSLS